MPTGIRGKLSCLSGHVCEPRTSPEFGIQRALLASAFLVAERKLGVAERRERRFERVAEIPFMSERKLMTTIEGDHEQGDALVAITRGAPDALLGRCTRLSVGMKIVALDTALRARLLADVDTLSDAALRAVAEA